MPDYTFAITGQDMSGAAWKTFIDNVKKANQQIAELGKPTPGGGLDKITSSIEAAKARIDSLVGTAKGVAALWAGNEAVQWARRTAAAADETQQLGKALGFTADQIQAMQIAAAKNGTTLQEQAAYYGKNRALLDEMTESMRRQGMIMAGPTRQGFADVNQEIEKVGRTWDSLRASFGDTGMVGQGLGVISSMIRDMGVSLAYVETYRGTVGLIREIGAIVTGGGGLIGVTAPERAAQFLDGLKKDALEAEVAFQKLDAQFRNIQNQPGEGVSAQARKRREEMRLQGDLTAARQRRDEANAAVARAEAAIAKAESIIKTAQSPLYIPTGRTADHLMGLDPSAAGGGGGGGPARDRIGENLQLYTDQAKAAQDALADLRAVALLPMPLDDLEREIKLRKAIADAMAQASKFAKDDPRKAQLEQQIRLRETAESEYQRFNSALKTADATERQYGNGQLQFLQTQNQLNDARATGRLTLEAYDNAMKINGQTTEDLRLKNLGLQGGFTGLAAGFENARVQSERANNMFATGGKLYEQVMGTMTMATRSWGQSFDQVLLNAGASWAQFLGNMALQAGTSSLFKMLSGTSGYNPGEAETLSIVGSGGGGFLSSIGSWLGGLFKAGGGPMSAGQPSIVGEFEPELWVPNTGGNVLNRQQLQALGVGGGGGGTVVNVYQTIHVGEFVTTTQYRQGMIAVERSAREGAQQGIIAAGRRGSPRLAEALR